MVIIAHGDTHLSLYMQLQSAAVHVGQDVAKGAVIGTVGGANTDLGPHLYFEIRGQNQIALDPISWLRSKQ
jgi:septal ring factor EnvC (AmiA/AmiB activator)